MSQKVKILHGVLGGKRTAVQLEKALRQAGFEVVQDVSKADILLAHSAGCMEVGTLLLGQKAVLVDPPYWPGKTVRERTRARSRSTFRFYRHGYPTYTWLIRNLWAAYYGIFDFKRTRHIIRTAPAFDLTRTIHGQSIILVRNEHDDWLTPELDELQHANPDLKVVRLPGEHDDFIYNPKPYVDLLQSVHG